MTVARPEAPLCAAGERLAGPGDREQTRRDRERQKERRAVEQAQAAGVLF